MPAVIEIPGSAPVKLGDLVNAVLSMSGKRNLTISAIVNEGFYISENGTKIKLGLEALYQKTDTNAAEARDWECELVLTKEEFVEMLETCDFISNNDEDVTDRFSGVIIDYANGKLQMASSDRVRAMICERQVTLQQINQHAKPITVIISHSNAVAIRKIIEISDASSVKLLIGNGELTVEIGDFAATCFYYYANIAAFLNVVPNISSAQISIKRNTLLRAIRRAVAFDHSISIDINVMGDFNIKTDQSKSISYFKTVMGAKATGNPIRVAVNGNYIVDFLVALNANFVNVSIGNESVPIKFTETSESGMQFTYVLMPLTTEIE